MTPDSSGLSLEEYRALRATIRERGTLRLIVTTITFVSWAAMAITFDALAVVPALGLIPLLVLVAGFEVIFAAHLAVERVGRYLQARYESADGLPAWEHVVMRLGQSGGAQGGIDPLFAGVFTAATLLNLVPIALLATDVGPELGGFPLELAVYGLIHLTFVGRLVAARRFASTQRQRDLELFQQSAGTPR